MRYAKYRTPMLAQKTPKNHKTSAMQADIDRYDAKSVYAPQKASGR